MAKKQAVVTHDGEWRKHRNKPQKRRSSKLTRKAFKKQLRKGDY